MKEINYHKNLDLVDLPNEEWKLISGYEEYYQVSNLGRVKSMRRYIPHSRHGQQLIHPKILKQKVNIDSNSISDQPMISCQAPLSKDGSIRYHNVRRLVYSAFIKELEYQDDGLYVINIDCNGYNNTVSNLKAISKPEKYTRSNARKRVPESYLIRADRSKWTKPYGGATNKKPIIKMSLSGTIIKRYDSITEASKDNNLDEKSIINVAKGKWKSSRGFKWKYANDD